MNLDIAQHLAGFFIFIFCMFLSVVIANTNPGTVPVGDFNWKAIGKFLGVWLITFLFYITLKLWGGA